jgi:hypothetical protein
MTATCADASRAIAEPLDGTGCPSTVHWLLVEYARPWRPQAVVDNELPEPARAVLRAWADAPDSRPLLVRQRGRRGNAVIYANVATGRAHRFELSDPAELANLPLQALRAGQTDAGRCDDQPILVCTHSSRDHCCGLHGAAVARALCDLAPQRVWQCTHLGGHRFAATVVALPQGAHFGRVQADEATALLAALDRGALYDLDRVRGEVALSAAAQAAALHVRRAHGATALSAIRVLSERPDGAETLVEIGGDVPHTTVRVTRVTRPESAPPSCGEPPAPTRVWVAQPA